MKAQVPRWIGIALMCLILPGFYSGLKTQAYRLDAGLSPRSVRLAFVSDLHSCAYGQDMDELVSAVDRQAPDLVLLGGDLFDGRLPEDNTLRFLERIAGRYPCYCVTGNHEYADGAEAFAGRMAALERLGVTRLSGEMARIEINGVRLNVCGVDDPAAWQNGFDPAAAAWPAFEDQLRDAAALPRDGSYTVLLAHRPELFDLYSAYGFDLVLSGHAHGGQGRIPLILNGLYAPGQGLFPKYAGGRYEKDGAVMIVSRGLARESTRLPRFYNRPELVIVDLQ